MKQLILTMSFLLASFNTAFAFQIIDNKEDALSAHLTSFEINHSNLEGMDTGALRLNRDKSTITLSLTDFNPECPDDPQGLIQMVCPTIKQTEIELPIIETFQGWCGSTTYIAEKDKTPVDGLLQRIEITDLSTIKCKILIPSDEQTEISYYSFNPWAQASSESHFKASRLAPLYYKAN